MSSLANLPMGGLDFCPQPRNGQITALLCRKR
jgi:hypothetical protein